MNRRDRVALVVVVGTCAAALASSCGGAARPATTPPMDGSASIRPSPARAERVPVGPASSPTPATSASP